MNRLHSADLWAQLRRLRKRRGPLLAAIAYVTDDSHISFGSGDVLVTDASDAAIRNGETSARILARALRREATLFSLPNLHAKILCVGGTAVVGSANLSASSRMRLHEAAVISSRPEIVAEVVQLIEALKVKATPIDAAFVNRVMAIPVLRRPPKELRGTTSRVSVRRARTWLVGLSGDPQYPGDEDTVEEVNRRVAASEPDPDCVGWFWWPSIRSRFVRLASVGDQVITIERPKERDRSGRGVRVCKHAVIRRIFRERGSGVTTYHYLSQADSDDSALTWRRFAALAARAGVKRGPTVGSTRELTPVQSAALHDLWPPSR